MSARNRRGTWQRRGVLAVLAAAGLTLVAGCSKKAEKAPLKVAAAADLVRAFERLGQGFEKETGERVVFSFGSTGLLAKQIEQGAPFDVFAAANESYVDGLIQKGAVVSDTKELYARGRVAVWTRKSDGVSPPKSLSELAEPRFVRIAIANPEHAPYGLAAKQALVRAGVWETVQRRLVFGENVQQTLQYAQSGNAEVALVALSLAMGSDGTFFVVDEALHEPIEQALVVCKGAAQPELARRFIAYLKSDAGKEIMREHGFARP